MTSLIFAFTVDLFPFFRHSGKWTVYMSKKILLVKNSKGLRNFII